MEQGDVVVLEDAEIDVSAAKLQALAHHVDDAVGQRMEFAEVVASIALDVDQGFPVAKAHGEVG
ncbi:hypothetical protein D3C71_2228000 [compost metagenome]